MTTLRWPRIVLGFLLLLGLLIPASAAVRLGTISVGAGYGYASGPFWGPYWGGYYSPFFYDSWFGYPAFAPVVFVAQPNLGEVSLKSPHKDAGVYLDGAYAGTVSRMKNFWLAPGVYELEVRAQGQTPQTKKIYVLTGKTLKISME